MGLNDSERLSTDMHEVGQLPVTPTGAEDKPEFIELEDICDGSKTYELRGEDNARS